MGTAIGGSRSSTVLSLRSPRPLFVAHLALHRMKREDLEHIIRAACDIAADDAVVVIGSQSILAAFPAAPSELLVSDEADVYPLHHPDRADLIDGTIGEGSPFHDTFGYYAQGVAVWTPFGPTVRAGTTATVPVHEVVATPHDVFDSSRGSHSSLASGWV